MKAPGSPFFERAYGSYTAAQRAVVLKTFQPTLVTRTLIDPFCGIGSLLPSLVTAGYDVVASDINPVATAFVELRRPVHLQSLASVRASLVEVLERLPRARTAGRSFEPSWLPPATAAWLAEYRDRISEVLVAPAIRSVLQLLPILVARRLTTYTASDNAAWIRPGGLSSGEDPAELLHEAFLQWSHYLYETYRTSRIGSLRVWTHDVLTPLSGGPFDGAFFSPPYANRLDYIRMFAPEAAVLEILAKVDVTGRSRQLIGTTVVRHADPNVMASSTLPKSVRDALARIRADKAKASATYYYPFFVNYANQLHAAMKNIIAALTPRSTGVIFLRDTPRKDVLFPAVDLVTNVLRKAKFRVETESTVVRAHIGMRRKNVHLSLQGLAQQEWSISFKGAK
jgi:hypothetical protein